MSLSIEGWTVKNIRTDLKTVPNIYIQDIPMLGFGYKVDIYNPSGDLVLGDVGGYLPDLKTSTIVEELERLVKEVVADRALAFGSITF